MGLSEDLARLSELYEASELTDAEFVAAKQALLASTPDGAPPTSADAPVSDDRRVAVPSPFAVLPQPSVAQADTGAVALKAARSWARNVDWKATFKVVSIAVAAGVGVLSALLALTLLLLVRDGSDFPGPSDLGIDAGGTTILLALQAMAAMVAMSFRGAWRGHATGGAEDLLGTANASVEVVLPLFGVAMLLLGALHIAVRRYHRTKEVASVRAAASNAAAYGVAFSAFVAVASLVARGSLEVEQEFLAIDLGYRVGFVVPVLWSLVLGVSSAFVALRPWRVIRTWHSVDARVTALMAGATAVSLQLAIATVGMLAYLVYQTLVSSQGAELDFSGRLGALLGALVLALPLGGSYFGMFGIGGSLTASADAPLASGGSQSVGLFGNDSLPAEAQIAAVGVAVLAAYAGGLWLAARHRGSSTPSLPIFAATFGVLWGAIAFFTSGRASVGGEMLGEATSSTPRVGFSVIGVVVGGSLVALAMAWAARRSASAVLPKLQRFRPLARMFPLAASASVGGSHLEQPSYTESPAPRGMYGYPAVATSPLPLAATQPAPTSPDNASIVPPDEAVAAGAIPGVVDAPDVRAETEEPDGPGRLRLRRPVLRWVAMGAVLLLVVAAGVVLVRQQRAIGTLTDDLTAAEADIATLENELDAAEADIDAAEQAASDAEANEATALDELAAARRSVAAAEERADDAEMRANDAEARAADAEDSLAAVEDSLASGNTGAGDGSDPYVAGLVEDCADGDYRACTDLYYESPIGSANEEFGATCGNNFSTWVCTDY